MFSSNQFVDQQTTSCDEDESSALISSVHRGLDMAG